MLIKTVLSISVASCLWWQTSAQQMLTLSDAISETIENNYGIQVARKNMEVAANNASKTAVGFRPTLNATAGSSVNIGGSTQKFGNGNENVVSNAVSYGGNAALSGNYTLYDQTRNVSLDQLKAILNLTDLQLRATIESNLAQLISKYFEVARLNATIKALQESIELSNRRLERVLYQYDYGQGLKIDVLNAEVDVQRDSITFVNTRQLLENSKRDLNVLMGQNIDADYDVDTSVVYLDLTFEDLRLAMSEDNIEVLLLDKNMHITEFDLKLIEAEKKPRLGASGSYSLSQQFNPPGAFITNSNNRGLNVGLNLNWSLYDGGLRDLREQNAQISLHTLDLQKEGLVLELERDLVNAWGNYQNALFVLRSEQTNLETSQLNFEQTEERFNLGQVSSVEFRQAQLNLINATTSFSNAKYDAKVIESQLLQLAGQLLQ